MKTLLIIACLLLAIGTVGAAGDERELLTNSRSPYVHLITLYDAEGRAISPSKGETTPFSIEATCAKCHDVSAIRSGWHFNAQDESVDPGRPGEPWILSDHRTGTQIPVSYRAWKGVWKPADLGVTDQDFLRRFGRQLPGGFHGTDDATMEMDCMACHASDRAASIPNDRVKLSEMGDWAFIPLQTMGLGTGRREAESVSGAGGNKDPFADFDPALEEGEKKQILEFLYDKSRFDSNDRVYLPISRHASNDSCLHCHTSIQHQASPTSTSWKYDWDVHLSAGLQCIDCHRNGIDHNITRGYTGESADPFVATLSCQGCHYGAETAEASHGAGRLGSPIPGHEGLPPIHFDVLSCTACHSGPMPSSTTALMQTSMAHGLGYPEFGRGRETVPLLTAPVFLKGHDGRIAPHKVIWSAFWGWKTASGIVPILPDELIRLAGATLARRETSREKTKPLSDEEIIAALAALASRAPAGSTPVYIAGGTARALAEGRLESNPVREADPYAWPLAHDVRPAGMALGAKGCQECHATGSALLAGSVLPTGPVTGAVAAAIPMGQMSGLDPDLHALWNQAFAGRDAFKVVSVLMLIVVTLGALSATLSTSGFIATIRNAFMARLALALHLLSVLLLAATGIVPLLLEGGPHGYVLIAHGFCAAIYMASLAMMACTGGTYSFTSPARRAAFSLLLWSGAVAIASMLLAMMPWFGTPGQEALILIHRIAAFPAAILGMIVPIIGLMQSRIPQTA